VKNIFKSNLICVKSGSTMRQAEEIMKDKRIRHLPVVDGDDRITGMLSRTDLTDVLKFADLPVDLFASFPVETVSADEKLSAVALKMIEKKISSVILRDDDGNAIGIITSEDLLFQLAQMLKKDEASESGRWDTANVLSTAGEFFRKLSDIGI
jgi:CBS domain-containing protein